jgi:hypothetical protein
MKTLLQGIVGSTAYGLHTAGSDVDRMAVFVSPTAEIVSLHPPKDSIVTNQPDVTRHEIGKFVRLVLNGNPSVTEMLWLDSYEVVDKWGAALIAMRTRFLSAPRVRNAYLGYAWQQFKDLERRGGTFGPDLRNRTEKHARHMRRLVEQGFQLYSTGQLSVRVEDAEAVHEFGRKVAFEASLDNVPADVRVHTGKTYMDEARERFDSVTSVLPEKPDSDTVNRWLVQLRKAHWEI